MNKQLIWVLLGLLPFSFLKGQENAGEFRPEGKMLIQVINRTLIENTGSSCRAGMYINRAHWGYRYQFAPAWSGTVVMDVGRPTIFGHLNVTDTLGKNLPVSYTYREGSYYTLTLKFSYLEYQPSSHLKLQAGGVLLNHYITQEKFWGYRYVYESFPDRYFGIPSADLGFIAYYSPAKWLSVDASVTNGEGFRQNQDEKGKMKYGLGFDLKPFKGWITRFYYDHSASADPSRPGAVQLISLFSGYRQPGFFRIAAEYDYHVNHGNIKGHGLYGYSFYGTYEYSPKFEIFARYDHLTSNTLAGSLEGWNHAADGSAFIAGFHFMVVANISLSLSYQGWKPADNLLPFKNTAAFSFEYRL